MTFIRFDPPRARLVDNIESVILHKSYIYLRTGLSDKYGLDECPAVELYADSDNRLIAFKPTNDITDQAFKIVRQQRSSAATVVSTTFMKQAQAFGYPFGEPLPVKEVNGYLVVEKGEK